MKKLMRWTKKPMTWGGYTKFAVICSAIGSILIFVTYIVTWQPTWYVKAKQFVTKPFRKTKSEECQESEEAES